MNTQLLEEDINQPAAWLWGISAVQRIHMADENFWTASPQGKTQVVCLILRTTYQMLRMLQIDPAVTPLAEQPQIPTGVTMTVLLYTTICTLHISPFSAIFHSFSF